MTQDKDYLDLAIHPIASIAKGVDLDVEKSEDILMLGYGLVLLAPMFAPISPPYILLPMMALCFTISVLAARMNFYRIRKKLAESMTNLHAHETGLLLPITEIFSIHPKQSLTESFNPIRNIKRTVLSSLGALLINPFWMPIFYTMVLQFAEERQLQLLNKAVSKIEEKTKGWP